MDETPREKIGFGVGVLGSILPAMVLAGFMPMWDVLPTTGWFAIAGLLGAVGGAIATPRLVRGALAGFLAGLGGVVGLWLYVYVRSGISEHFLRIELVLGACVGAAPGLVLYSKCARDPRVTPAI